MLCSGGAFGTCQCDKQGADALGDAGIAADSADPDDAQPDSTQAEATGPDGVVVEDAQGDVSEPACQSDKDCKDLGKACDPLSNVCVACLTDAECGPNQHCETYACQDYTPCANSLACKGAKGPDGKEQPICDQTIGECSACLSAADCPASHDCIAKQCIAYTTCKNSTDCSKDEVCDKAANRCVQCLGDNDCSANQLCEAGQCNSFIPCTSDKQCTDKGLLCDQTKGKCAQCLQNSDCPAIYNCQSVGVAKSGKCVLDICAQGQGACATNQKVTCNQVGDGYGSPQPCPGQSTCVAPGGKPECKVWVCTPGASCQGEKAVECSADGLEVLKSTDCAASAQKCFGGACKAQICSPGQAFCDGQVAKQCDAAGVSSSTVKTCGLSEFCDGGACKPQICLPNQPVCDANSAKTCNSVGSGYTDSGKDCGPTAKCISGECKAKVCTPATQFCEAGFLKTCSPDGMSVTGSAECGTGKYCGLNTGGDAACLPWVCEPNKATCSGTVATTCKADGSGYQDAGTECKIQGKICAQGLCKSLLCDPLAPAYCDLNTAMKCDASGLNSSTVQVCGVGTYCDKGVCQKQICEPGKAGCYGQIASMCNASGSGWVEGGTDCKAAGKVCGAGACLAGFASCKAALAANPTAIDGLYSIDPDGAGPIAGAELFCDMKNGGLTLVANIFNTAGDDIPNDTSYVVSGWQQTGNGAWQTSASKVDRDATGKGSAAVSMAFVAALKASAGQQHLKMCFVDQGGAEVACRSSADASLTLASYAGGNPKLATHSADKLTYTFGRLAGLPGPMDCYNANACFGSGYCIGVQPGGSFGNGCGTQPGICGFGGVGKVEEQPGFVWHGFCGGGAYAPYRTGAASHLELTDPANPGFRLYVGPGSGTCSGGPNGCCTKDTDCVANGALNPTMCQVKACDVGSGVCVLKAAVGFCAIGDLCVTSGAVQDGSAGCMVCDPKNPTQWTPKSTGTTCSLGGCMSNAKCDGSGTCAGVQKPGCCIKDEDCDADTALQPTACEVKACGIDTGKCILKAVADCCTSGKCCDVATKSLAPSGALCGAPKSDVEYKCEGNASYKRDIYSAACTGNHPTQCSSSVKGYGEWTVIKDCADLTCTQSSPTSAPICK